MRDFAWRTGVTSGLVSISEGGRMQKQLAEDLFVALCESKTCSQKRKPSSAVFGIAASRSGVSRFHRLEGHGDLGRFHGEFFGRPRINAEIGFSWFRILAFVLYVSFLPPARAQFCETNLFDSVN